MRILGISDASVCGGAALWEDGRVSWAIDEERLNREKLATGFPALSIAAVLSLSGTRPEDLDAVFVADQWNYYQPTSERWQGWLQHSPGPTKTALYAVSSRIAPWVAPVGGDRAFYALKKLATADRRAKVKSRIRDEFGIAAPVRFADHHHCHALSAYLTGGKRRCTVITLDGGGDTLCSRVYRIRDDRITPLAQTSSFHSIGNFYAYVTHLCGFTAHKHEGKITGLAARGEPIYQELLRELIAEENGRLRNRKGVYYWSGVQEIARRLPRGWRRRDLAASIQKHLESEVTRFVAHWVEQSGEPDLVVAGGVFANVRLNQFVEELPGVRSFFVHPGMGDEGLAYGAACAGAWKLDREAALRVAETPLSDVYLGPDCPRAEIEEALAAEGLLSAPRPDIVEDVAELLAEGRVVARCAGRMEYGPRALGNRSILYRPDEPSVNQWLNERLDRTEFMPFAPMTPIELVDDVYERAQSVRHAAQFMTITRDCRPEARKGCSGVVHVDGTARPQYVTREAAPAVHEILTRFKRRTGLPCVINTSFNIHEEPIVGGPRDAVRAFLKGHLDYLALGDFLVAHPALAPRAPVEERVSAAVAAEPVDVAGAAAQAAAAGAEGEPDA